MNRELKFRSWNPIYGMGKGGTIFELTKFEMPTDGSKVLSREFPPETIFMQYTGLKDKNGKEIYEGDVVKEKEGTMSTIVFKTTNEKGDLDIDRVIIGWLREWNDGGLSPIGFYEIPQFEIIGNICENPELITRAAGV